MKFIAELCQNHNGNSELVFQMLDEAVQAGATHVKLQHIYVENLTFRKEFENGGEDLVSGTQFISRPFRQEYNRLKKLELSLSVCEKFIELCNKNNVIPMTTCFCTQHSNILRELGFNEIKVASYDCASPYLLKSLKEQDFQHIYVSTGATFDSEIERCVEILKDNFTLLHCVTRYPTPLNRLNLRRLDWLSRFSKEVGYSDHSETSSAKLFPIMAAIYEGAKVIEGHFTVLASNETKDGPVSINRKDIESVMSFASLDKNDQKLVLNDFPVDYEMALGSSSFRMSSEEYQNRLYYRGRFASIAEENGIKRHVYNWEPFSV